MNILMIAAVAFGIELSAEVISFISNELTEEDKKIYDEIKTKVKMLNVEAGKKRKEIINYVNDFYDKQVLNYRQQQKHIEQNASDVLEHEYERQQEAYLDFESRTISYWQRQQNEANLTIADKERIIEQQLQDLDSLLCENIVFFLNEKATERISYVENLIKELKGNLDILTKYKQEQCTQLRKNAFEMLKQELKTTINKAYAYKQYLKKYCQHIKQIYTHSDEVIFSYSLPDNYPYEGAILYLSLEELSLKNGWGQLLFHKVLPVEVYLKDYEIVNENNFQAQPLYVEGNDYYEKENAYSSIKRRAYGLSLQKGVYFLCKRSGGFSGIPAKVSKYSRNSAIVSYGQDMHLVLKQQNMTNSKHYPPIGSEIIVYPMYEDYNTKPETYYVSQRIEDTEISLSFDEIPILIPQDKLLPFCQYFTENNVDKEYDYARIAPLDESNVYGQKVKIQFQDNFIMCAHIQSDNKRQYFVFDNFLNIEEGIHAEDVFVTFHATITMYDEDELFCLFSSDENVAISNSMNYLIMTVLKEFKLQKEIKTSQEGSKYFSAWEQLTNELRQYLTDGERIECTVTELPYVYEEYKTNDLVFRYSISDNERLKRYYQKHMNDGYHSAFFIKYENLRLITTISPSCEQVRITVPSLYKSETVRMQLLELSELVIYKQENCVSEIRQLTALHHFKAGYMSNEKLHLYALNASSIIPEYTSISDIKLFNTKLSNDKSQRKALDSCLCEKNWFMIQGPPGTGKTTVIRELIRQTILQNSQAKILIVSQANVAVDNVL